MKLYLNAGLGPGELIQAVKELGWEGLRFGGTTDATAPTLEQVQAAKDAGLGCLCIVGSTAHLEPLRGTGVDIEVWNEPDLGTNGQLSVGAYRALVADVIDASVGMGLGRIWFGAVSNLNQRGLNYLRDVFQGVASGVDGVGCSFHRYPNGGYNESPMKPHDGCIDRNEEVQMVRRYVGDRPLAVTEMGYHTAPRRAEFRDGFWPWLTRASRRWTDAEVLTNLRVDKGFWEQQGVDLMTVYQINDGPDRNNKEHCYGIRRYGDPWNNWKVSSYLPGAIFDSRRSDSGRRTQA